MRQVADGEGKPEPGQVTELDKFMGANLRPNDAPPSIQNSPPLPELEGVFQPTTPRRDFICQRRASLGQATFNRIRSEDPSR